MNTHSVWCAFATDFDSLSNLAIGVKTEAGKDKARIGRRPRKSPSREHLKKMSTGGIGEELQPVRLTVVPEDQVVSGFCCFYVAL